MLLSTLGPEIGWVTVVMSASIEVDCNWLEGMIWLSLLSARAPDRGGSTGIEWLT